MMSKPIQIYCKFYFINVHCLQSKQQHMNIFLQKTSHNIVNNNKAHCKKTTHKAHWAPPHEGETFGFPTRGIPSCTTLDDDAPRVILTLIQIVSIRIGILPHLKRECLSTPWTVSLNIWLISFSPMGPPNGITPYSMPPLMQLWQIAP